MKKYIFLIKNQYNFIHILIELMFDNQSNISGFGNQYGLFLILCIIYFMQLTVQLLY